MTTTDAPARRARRTLPRTARRMLLIAHIVFSVALLGTVWSMIALALRARSADSQQATDTYLLMESLTPLTAIPLSMASLVTGIALGLGTHWGVFRHGWVSAKLGMLVAAIALGAGVTSPLLVELAADPRPGLQATHLAVAATQAMLLLVSTGLSVIKPKRRAQLASSSRR